MQYVRYAAKAYAAMLAAFLGAIAAYNLEVPPAVLVAIVTIGAGLAVFYTPNGDNPAVASVDRITTTEDEPPTSTPRRGSAGR